LALAISRLTHHLCPALFRRQDQARRHWPIVLLLCAPVVYRRRAGWQRRRAFHLQRNTADFQAITIQGQLTYRVTDPQKVSSLLNFTLAPNHKGCISDDPAKLPQRIINLVQVLTRAQVQRLPLRSALTSSDAIVESVMAAAQGSEALVALGIQLLAFSILGVRPTPEMAKALEAEAREELQRKSDEAIYARRNAAVEQERKIKENELSTEIAVEEKKRQIREAQMDAEIAVEEKNVRCARCR